jgi:hypothetical protein
MSSQRNALALPSDARRLSESAVKVWVAMEERPVKSRVEADK